VLRETSETSTSVMTCGYAGQRTRTVPIVAKVQHWPDLAPRRENWSKEAGEGWPESKRLTTVPRKAIVAAALLGTVTVAAIVGVSGFTGGDSSPGTAEAHAFLEQIPQSPSFNPGDIVYKKMELWSRFGPKADEISRQSPVGTERQTIETWGEVGLNNTFVRNYGRTADSNGRLVQETVLRPGEPGIWRTTSLKTGAVLIDRPYQPVKIEHEGRTMADEFQAALTDGRGRVVSQTAGEL
jgi:hypothetical protein